jgi:hypothetical protein
MANQKLQRQSEATRYVADTSTAPESTQQDAHGAADTIDGLQRQRARAAAAAAVEPVLVLADNATEEELRTARQRRAVAKGKSVYLPSWRDEVVGLPNALLRSALFSVSGPSTESLLDHPIAVLGDTSITLTGNKLTDYDRQVFAAVLCYYADRPLSNSVGDSDWIRVSYRQFSAVMGHTSGANVNKAIHDSLIRLNAAHLRLRINRRDIPLPTLVEVVFNNIPVMPEKSAFGSMCASLSDLNAEPVDVQLRDEQTVLVANGLPVTKTFERYVTVKAVPTTPATLAFSRMCRSLASNDAEPIKLQLEGEVTTVEAEVVRFKTDVAFRVQREMAELFGPTDWSSVPKVAFQKYSGLPRWLSTFYSTHSKPYPLPVAQLLKLSDSTCSTSEFRRRLKVALTKLQEETTPRELRVKDFQLDPESDKLIVHLVRWDDAVIVGKIRARPGCV